MGNIWCCYNKRDGEYKRNMKSKYCTSCHERKTSIDNEFFCNVCFLLEEPYEYNHQIY